MPLARVESKEGIAAYADNSVHLPPVFAWELPTDPLNPAAHVDAWRLHQIAQKEEQHQQTWQQRQDGAKTVTVSDRIHYYQCDHLGTPLELLDTQGEAVWSAQYKAWGGILHYERLEIEQPLRFQGQYEDAETGLYYNRHRYYDPDSARYVTQDPIGLLGGANSYQYAPNPVGWADPLGLARKKGGCDPCCNGAGGKVVAEARSKQGSGKYPGVDSYQYVVMKKGTAIYSLHPGGPPGFAVKNYARIKAGHDAKAYHDLTQVQSTDLPPGKTMRTKINKFIVQEDICVAKGKAVQNGDYGEGGATQYYVSAMDTGKLKQIGRERPI